MNFLVVSINVPPNDQYKFIVDCLNYLLLLGFSNVMDESSSSMLVKVACPNINTMAFL